MVSHPPPLPLMIMTPPTTDDHSAAAHLPDHLQDQEAHISNKHLAAAVLMKRKRTKRPRHHHQQQQPPSSSGESTTTEEEDMAHCLILLAQGAVDSKPSPPAPQPAVADSNSNPSSPQQPPPAAVDSKKSPSSPPPAGARTERYSSRKYTELAAATPDGARAGFYVYECKTCNKCFPTFQALGGHRASHKKPRLATTGGAEDDAAAVSKQHGKPQTTPATTAMAALPLQQPPRIDVVAVFPDVTTALSLNSSSSVVKLRVHECSICGAEFGSGQALGGHMRRHRPLNAPDRAVTTAADTGSKKEATTTINLELDLNLPAPSDEESGLPPAAVMLGLGKFSDGNKAGLVLTATALVDCHY